MKKNTLKTLGIMVLSTVLVASAVVGCGSKETADVQPTEVVEAVVETETVEETEVATESTEEVVTEDTELTETAEVVDATEMVEETEVAEVEPAFTVTDMSATKYATSSVKVRSGASTDYEQIGSLSTNQKVTVTGQADTGWYRIEYKGEVGYVSNKYLSDTKVAVNTPTQTAPTQNQSTSTPTDNTQAQTPVVDNSGWTGDTSTSTPSTPSTDTSAPVPTPDASTSTPSTDTGSAGSGVEVDPNTGMTVPEGVLDIPVYDSSVNPDVEGMGGGIF